MCDVLSPNGPTPVLREVNIDINTQEKNPTTNKNLEKSCYDDVVYSSTLFRDLDVCSLRGVMETTCLSWSSLRHPRRITESNIEGTQRRSGSSYY